MENFPNPSMIYDREYLSKISEEIDIEDTELVKGVVKAVVEMSEYIGHCFGLAGIQIGIPYRVSYIRVTKDRPIVLVNPKIINHSSKMIIYKGEGCMSFPRKWVDTKRYEWVEVEDSIEGLRRYEGTEAICIQHEIDHMNGVTILDHREDCISKRTGKKVGRNDICPLCNSGKKYKKCCLK